MTGLVRERGTGKPVVGAGLSFTRPGESTNARIETDSKGRYSVASLGGKGTLFLEPSTTHVALGPPFRKEVEVPDADRTLEIEPIEVIPTAPAIRVVARDEAGRPMAGAKVQGHWSYIENSHSQVTHFAATAADDGSATIGGMPPGASVELTARLHDKATGETVKIRAGNDVGPIELALGAADTTALTGRVLGPGDRPVTNAIIKVIRQTRVNNMNTQDWGEAQFDDNAIISTGPDGTYRTPKELDRPNREFRVEITAEGYLPNQSNWVPAGAGDIVRMPDMRLRKEAGLRAISGRVIDRDGKPIAGAKVFQSGDGPARTEASTDAAGQFRLNGVYAGPALVFAEKDGFRFGGAIAKGNAVDVRLARVGEPPIRALKSLPPKLSRAEERKLGLTLLTPALPRVRAGELSEPGMIGSSTSAEATLARLDPERALTMVENRVVAQPTEILRQAAIAQYEDDPREAIATIEADAAPSARASGFLALANVEADRAKRSALIDRALVEARKIDDSAVKLSLFEIIARSLIDDGAPERATPILREGQKMLAGFKDWQDEGERFAEILGVIDLPAARTILGREAFQNVSAPNAGEIDRHLVEVAARVAATDPDEAERLIAGFSKDFYEREPTVLRVAMAMAPNDPARARKLLDKLRHPDDTATYYNRLAKPYGLGLIASAIAGSDPKAAASLLDESYAEIKKIAVEQPPYAPSAANHMAALLPVVERLAPDRLEERMMLAAALRPSHAEKLDPMAPRPLAVLATLIARYDRDVAAVVFSPVGDALPELAASESGLYVNEGDLAPLLVAYDPQVIVDLIAGLPESARKVTKNPNGYLNAGVELPARLRAAHMLGLWPAERRLEAMRNEGFNRPPAIEK